MIWTNATLMVYCWNFYQNVTPSQTSHLGCANSTRSQPNGQRHLGHKRIERSGRPSRMQVYSTKMEWRNWKTKWEKTWIEAWNWSWFKVTVKVEINDDLFSCTACTSQTKTKKLQRMVWTWITTKITKMTMKWNNQAKVHAREIGLSVV